jgi:hypothetical protein
MTAPLSTDEKKVTQAVRANAVEAVEQIIHDLRDRAGIGNEWDEIDAGIQYAIRTEWENLILREFGYDV